jgi:hypothetical protein
VRIIITMLAVGLSGGCVTLSGYETKSVDKTMPLASTGSVRLDTHNGSIQVNTWDREEIEIHARIEAGGIFADDLRRLEQTTVDISGTADSVWITSRYPAFTWSWSGGNPTIHYTITAPRRASWTIRDHNARVEIRDVDAALNLETHNGSLHAENHGGPLDVSAHNGSVKIEFATFRGANLTLHNGSAELLLPAGSHFDLHGDTHHASIHSDFSLLTRAFHRDAGHLEGTVNGGGPALRFSSHNGRLRIRSK